MASNIDPANPTSGNATTQSVRDNFQAAKDEIEALQAQDTTHTADIATNTAELARLRRASKSADTSRTSTTTLTADPHLLISALSLNARYKITGYLRVQSSVSSTGTTVRLVPTQTGFDAASWTVSAILDDSPDADTFQTGGIDDTVDLSVSDTNTHGVALSGYIVTGSAGDVDWEIQWAQTVSSGSACIVFEGSWIKAERMD